MWRLASIPIQIMSETVSSPSPTGEGFVDVAGLALRVSALESKVAALTPTPSTVTPGVDPAAVIKAVEQLEAQHGS